jgi:UDPglucose--hexose-1-phosphate uridylyltransferase
MPEFRRDPIVGRWVIVAAGRGDRPHDFERLPPRRVGGVCPFCVGHEEHTPGELFALRAAGTPPDKPGWRLRVVPNKYPALELGDDLGRQSEGVYERMEGVGAHEVIIESPRHVVSLADLAHDEVCDLLAVYRQRLTTHKHDPRLKYGLLFKNVGPAAGASLEHTHSQLIVTPIVPINVWEEMTGGLEFYHVHGRCVWCRMIEQELSAGQRVVAETERFAAFCPFASRFALETWIVPKLHASHFEGAADDQLADLAGILRQVIGRCDAALGQPGYNYIVHTAPFDTHDLTHFHWHIEVMPSLSRTAGFEWGTGFYINPVPPEQAAAMLRG